MRNLYFGLDLGHYEIKFSIIEEDINGKLITYNQSIKNEYLKDGEILESEGLINILENIFYNTLTSFNLSKLERINICFNFPHFQSYLQKGHSMFEGNIKEADIERAIKTARTSLLINNQEILIEEPIKFILDGQQELRDPLGFNGRRLDVEVFFITCHKSILEKFNKIFYELKINKINYFPSFYAASKICLNKKDKEIGTILLDLGAETTTLSIFQYGKLINYRSFNFGGEKLTEDLAMQLRLSLEEAEKIKLDFFNNVPLKDSKKKLKIKKIIEKKIKEYVEKNNLKTYLKEIKSYYRLPGGIVLTGGFAKILSFENLLKNIFDFQIRLAKDYNNIFEKDNDILKYSASVGCALLEKELLNKKDDWWHKIKNFFTFRP